ncbi:RDD family protein [Marinoscillum sp. 108]|uniref:RDD family protein n=1 Tax=Marinoscillum sp. 108 TaxID=2653151 RepID=UPI0012F1FB29|nr:RDD family protein [Marinoscillum sp. 108]VXD15851.1 putative RDD family membrane protein YckC [Marinoscillum sp. 108]
MDKRNIFSDKFEKKSTDELLKVINEGGYEKEAKLAAIWELERRNEATDEQRNHANQLAEEQERKKASKLSGQRYQTFWLRFFAAIIDGFVMWPIGFLLSYITGSNIGVIVIIGNLLNSFAPYIYSIFLHGHYGHTLGKMAMGVKVVDFDNEDEIDLNQAFIRDSVPVALMILLYAYSFIIFYGNEGYELQADFVTLAPMFFIGLLNLLWTILEIFSMLFNDKSRAVHDLIARTVVVRTS